MKRIHASRFAATLLIGFTGGVAFRWLDMPMPWVLGPLVLCLVANLLGLRTEMPSLVRIPAIAVIGVLLGSPFSNLTFSTVAGWFPSLLAVIAYVFTAAITCIWYLRRFRGVDFRTAYYAGMPGGLVEMSVQAEERGGDVQRVVLIHSLRVVLIVFTLPFLPSLITGAWIGSTPIAGTEATGGVPIASLAWLAGCAALGAALGYLLRLPAGFLLGPVIVSGLVHATGLSDFQVPAGLVAAAQLVIGIVLTTRFTGIDRNLLTQVLWQALDVVVILMGLSIAFAYVVAQFVAHDFITLLLAMSAGGLTESTLVALAVDTDVAFVSTHHLLRIIVIALGAPIAFWIFARFTRDGDT